MFVGGHTISYRMDLLMAYGDDPDEKNLAEKKFLECNCTVLRQQRFLRVFSCQNTKLGQSTASITVCLEVL
jgi:hypothetical protein